MGELSNTMKSSERTSLLSPMQRNSGKIKEAKKESDDEYVDDEFDFEDEEESGKKPLPEKKEEVDFAISASASMLPPLSGQGQKAMDAYQSQGRPQGKDLKPEHFALNLADSNPSLDFDISGSRGAFGGSGNEYGQSLQRSRRGTEKQGSNDNLNTGLGKSGSMDSHDFGLSESNFSMSRPGGLGAGGSGYEKRPNLGLAK
jgi:hypothetical protein